MSTNMQAQPNYISAIPNVFSVPSEKAALAKSMLAQANIRHTSSEANNLCMITVRPQDAHVAFQILQNLTTIQLNNQPTEKGQRNSQFRIFMAILVVVALAFLGFSLSIWAGPLAFVVCVVLGGVVAAWMRTDEKKMRAMDNQNPDWFWQSNHVKNYAYFFFSMIAVFVVGFYLMYLWFQRG